jgi:hypothetical protein
MTFLDKAKAAARDAATAAKKGAAITKDKAGDAMLRRKADDAAKQIGYLVHKERTGGPPAGPEIDRLVLEITSFEAQIAEAPEPGEGSEPGTMPE